MKYEVIYKTSTSFVVELKENVFFPQRLSMKSMLMVNWQRRVTVM